jgi:UDP-N-acetylglucosamine 2-epimerase
MLSKIEEVLLQERPDFVLVYGDTNSTLAGTVAAVKLHIPSVHVEAGLRSFNRYMPEEINRIMADHAANILMCPTLLSVKNLQNEGICLSTDKNHTITLNDQRVYEIGDVMYDSFLFYSKMAEKKSDILQKLNINSGKFTLATVHRAENTDNSTRFRNITQSFQDIASEDFPLILPLHPRSRKFLGENGIEFNNKHVIAIDPVGYIDMVQLENNAGIIITDSGGVQKEAFFANVPCITLREQTEWIETLDMGWNCLAGDNPQKIREAFTLCQNSTRDNPPFSNGNIDEISTLSPYGDGKAAQKIVNLLAGFHP